MFEEKFLDYLNSHFLFTKMISKQAFYNKLVEVCDFVNVNVDDDVVVFHFTDDLSFEFIWEYDGEYYYLKRISN